MFAFDFVQTGIYIPNKFYVFLLLGLVVAFSGYFSNIEKKAQQWYENVEIGKALLVLKSFTTVLLGWWCLIEIFGSDFNPFIYFKF